MIRKIFLNPKKMKNVHGVFKNLNYFFCCLNFTRKMNLFKNRNLLFCLDYINLSQIRELTYQTFVLLKICLYLETYDFIYEFAIFF